MFIPFLVSSAITLIHAVDKPLISPEFQNLVAIKKLGETIVTLSDKISVSGKSTQKLDILAEWVEIYDLSQWNEIKNSNEENDTGIMIENVKASAFEVFIAKEDTVANIFNQHQFPDTKYRRVKYKAQATSRFREYFPKNTDAKNFIRKSDPVTIDVLNSARPPVPNILYIIPTFKWKGESKRGWIRKRRGGGSFRIYLDPPWFSSGEGELLGVVLWTCSPLPYGASTSFDLPDFVKPYVTQWGMDPIWLSNPLPTQSVPLLEHFTQSSDDGTQLSVEEFSYSSEFKNSSVSVAGHCVKYDKRRKLWYCDIELDPSLSYYPFVRLALSRYQPKSIHDAHLSRVVLADFIQLMPDRSAFIIFDPSNDKKIQVSVSGLTHDNPIKATMQVTLEIQSKENSDNGTTWVPLSTTELNPVSNQEEETTTLWNGFVILPSPRKARSYRLRIEEFEIFPTGIENENKKRLVYADVIELSND